MSNWHRRDAIRALTAATGVTALSAFVAARQSARWANGAVIRTLLRDEPPDVVTGATLFHEHLSLQDHTAYQPPRPAPPQPHYTVNADLVTEEVRAAAADGLGCIVDAGHTDMGRSMESLRRIASASGVRVVASGGYWLQRSHPPELASQSDEQIADALVKQAAAERWGALGEIGTSDEMTPGERNVLRAIGRAHARTRLPIFTHSAVYPATARDAAMRSAMLQLDVLESAGVDPRRVAVGHVCCHDDPQIAVPLAIARRGAFVGFDRVGTGVMILPDEKRVAMALAFINAGHADKLLLSSDFSFERDLKRNGGAGYAMTLTVFVPKLRAAGVDAATIRQITVDNPRALLAFVPAPAV